MKGNLFRFIQKVLRTTGYISPYAASFIAFYLFCRPLPPSPIGRLQKKIMDSAHRSHIFINGKKVAIYSWGSGVRPVLMMHGWCSRGASFTKLVEKLLDAGYSPIVFDAPGHGESEGKTTTILEYEQICIQISQNYGRFSALVGHSFGTLSMFKAFRKPIPVDKLISISGVCDFSYLEQEFSKQLQLTPSVQKNFQKRIEVFFTPNNNIWQKFSAPYEAEKKEIPVLIVHDKDDSVVNIKQAKKIFDAYSNSEIYETHGLGHQRILLNKKVAQKIADFISQ